MNVSRVVLNFLRLVRDLGFGAAARAYWIRILERMNEMRLGIHSSDIIELKEFDLHHIDRRDYYPTQFHDFRMMTRFLKPETPDDVFIDYGAGLGRAVILAAMLPFKRVIGIEISPTLAERARENVYLCREKLQCEDIEIVNIDAAAFEVPADAAVIFFNNPFGGTILTDVLSKIKLSHEQRPRPIKLVCNLPLESAFRKQIVLDDGFELCHEIRLREERRCLIFSVKPGQVPLMRPTNASIEILPHSDLVPTSVMTCWRECVRISPNLNVCLQTPEWFSYRWHAAKRYLAVLREAGNPAPLGVTPFVQNLYGVPLTVAGKLLGTLRFDAVLLNGNVPLFPSRFEYYQKLFTSLLSIPSIQCICLLGVPKSSSFWKFLNHVQKEYSEFLFYLPSYASTRFFYIDMSESHGSYLKKFKSKTVYNFRRNLRLLERANGGPVELEKILSPAQVAGFLHSALPLSVKSWQKVLLAFNVDQHANTQDVLEAFARQGILRAYLLKSSEHVLAYAIGLQINDIFYFASTAYDPQWSKFSPGQSLLYLIIQDCFENDKPKTFYFGTGDVYYKELFANRSGEEVVLIVFKRTVANSVKIFAHRSFRKCVEVLKLLMPLREKRPKVNYNPIAD
jgi:predicted RNA methylase